MSLSHVRRSAAVTRVVFTEGGRVRTAVCTDGQWKPASVADCRGHHDSLFRSALTKSTFFPVIRCIIFLVFNLVQSVVYFFRS